jgi:hypothetical protein
MLSFADVALASPSNMLIFTISISVPYVNFQFATLSKAK